MAPTDRLCQWEGPNARRFWIFDSSPMLKLFWRISNDFRKPAGLHSNSFGRTTAWAEQPILTYCTRDLTTNGWLAMVVSERLNGWPCIDGWQRCSSFKHKQQHANASVEAGAACPDQWPEKPAAAMPAAGAASWRALIGIGGACTDPDVSVRDRLNSEETFDARVPASQDSFLGCRIDEILDFGTITGRASD